MYTLAEVAQILRYSMSSIYGFTHTGKLRVKGYKTFRNPSTHYRMKHTALVTEDELKRFIDEEYFTDIKMGCKGKKRKI